MLIDIGKVDENHWCKWEEGLNWNINKAEWERTCKYIMDISVNVAIREAYYEIIGN